jgi:hypothetical protein
MRSEKDARRIVKLLENTVWLYPKEEEFLDSFLKQYELRGGLSEKQWAVVERIEGLMAWRQNRKTMRG